MSSISPDLKATRDAGEIRFHILAPTFVDEHRIERAHSQMHAIVAMESSPKVIISFDGVHNISSMFIRSLIDLRTTAKKAGGSIQLVDLHENLSKMFKAVKLDSMFEIK